MITARQLRASRALLGIDQHKLAEMCDLSVNTIERMETSEDIIRGTVESLTKLVEALNAAGIELIAEHAVSSRGGYGVRLKEGVKSHDENHGRTGGRFRSARK